MFVFLCSVCAAAMSLSFSTTQARYRTQANVPASGQIARWNPTWSGVNSWLNVENTGIVFHPGNWTDTRNIDWRVTNNGDVTMQSQMIPMRITNRATGARRALAQADFAAASTFPAGTLTLPAAAGQQVPFDQSRDFRFSIRGYNSQPPRPADSIGTGTITRAAPIRFGVGENTVTAAYINQLWRVVRINADGIDTQLD